MKNFSLVKTGLFLMAMTLAPQAHAVMVFCSGDGETNQQNLFVEEVGDDEYSYTCSLVKTAPRVEHGKLTEFFDSEDSVRMKIKGAGLGFRTAVGEGFMISCPLIFNFDRVKKSPFYGLKVTAAVGVGTSIGIFANERAGVCVLTGAQGGIGAGVSGAKLTFE